MNKNGKIIQVIGAVVDVQFEGDLPEILTALVADNSGNKLILEVAQQNHNMLPKNRSQLNKLPQKAATSQQNQSMQIFGERANIKAC